MNDGYGWGVGMGVTETMLLIRNEIQKKIKNVYIFVIIFVLTYIRLRFKNAIMATTLSIWTVCLGK